MKVNLRRTHFFNELNGGVCPNRIENGFLIIDRFGTFTDTPSNMWITKMEGVDFLKKNGFIYYIKTINENTSMSDVEFSKVSLYVRNLVKDHNLYIEYQRFIVGKGVSFAFKIKKPSDKVKLRKILSENKNVSHVYDIYDDLHFVISEVEYGKNNTKRLSEKSSSKR